MTSCESSVTPGEGESWTTRSPSFQCFDLAIKSFSAVILGFLSDVSWPHAQVFLKLIWGMICSGAASGPRFHAVTRKRISSSLSVSFAVSM